MQLFHALLPRAQLGLGLATAAELVHRPVVFRAEALLQPLTRVRLGDIAYYQFDAGSVAGVDCFVSRTGYTGEDGFELYCRDRSVGILWTALTTAGAAPMLEVEGLDVAYGDFQVLWQAAMHVGEGEIVAILGPNGAGKSTLMNSISGLITPRAGRITFLGKRIESREIRSRRRAGGVIWFDFQTLCGGPRSQNDYLEIASQFHTLLLSNVPQMAVRQASEARRFTWLIDVLYDRRVKLVMSAAVSPEQLYTDGPMAHEFPRTVSRLGEMQSAEYLALAHRTVDTGLT